MKRFNAWFTLPSALNEARTLYIHCLKKGRKVNAQVKGQESLLIITRFQNRRFIFLRPPIRAKENTYPLISTAPKGGTDRFVL
jgi:hypothetical protein